MNKTNNLDFSAIAVHNEKRIQDKILVGCATEVRIQGEPVWESVHGMADIENGRKMHKDAIFRLASMSKPITGVAVMQLVESGKLGLYDDISRYIPELKDFGLAGLDRDGNIIRIGQASRGITPYDILSHSSGLIQAELGFRQYDDPGNHFRPQKNDTLATATPRLKDVLLDCEPGTAIGYGAHAAFDTLGYLVECITGMTFGEYLEKNITGPLGMTDTTFHPTPEQLSRLVKIYTADGVITPGPDVRENMITFPESFEGGSSALLGTLSDYVRFSECLRCEGTLSGVRILKPETVRMMRAPQTKPNMLGYSTVQVWGLSMRVLTDESPDAVLPKGSYGWSGAYGTHFFICPKYDLTAVYMSNLMNGGGSGAPTAFEFERDIMAEVKKKLV